MVRFPVLIGIVCLTHAAGQRHPAAKAMPEAINEFAFDLYHELARESGNEGRNLFFSPYSVSEALTMAAEGARGETAVQMGRVLRYPRAAIRNGEAAHTRPWRMEIIHGGMSDLRNRLHAHEDSSRIRRIDAGIARLRGQIETLKKGRKEESDAWMRGGYSKEYLASIEQERKLVARLNALLEKTRPYDLEVANSLWAEIQYPFETAYFDVITKYFGTGRVYPADFRNQPAAERLRINGWVEEQTERRIKDLIPESGITKETRLVLVNAIYFKGEWSMPFKERDTQVREFTLAGAGKVAVPTLLAPKLDSARYAAFNADGSYFDTPARRDCHHLGGAHSVDAYPDSGGFQIVELDYKGGEISMVVVVPNHHARLPELEEKLTGKNLAAWLGRLQRRPVAVFLPKFKVETSYSLGDFIQPKALQKMGMTRAFKDPRLPDGAEFDGMTRSRSPADKLYISLVVHKAFVEVDEKGTEAAAATAVVMAQPVSGRVDCRFTPQVRADRPFVYFIRHRGTGTLLFLGRMMNPG